MIGDLLKEKFIIFTIDTCHKHHLFDIYKGRNYCLPEFFVELKKTNDCTVPNLGNGN